MNKLEVHIFNAHRMYFGGMLNRRFSMERRLQFGDSVHREMLMYISVQGGIIARHPPLCFGIAP